MKAIIIIAIVYASIYSAYRIDRAKTIGGKIAGALNGILWLVSLARALYL